MCGGKFDRFKIGDVVRLLTYGMGENVDRVRRRLVSELNDACVDLREAPINARVVDDRFLLRNVDDWYDFAHVECSCRARENGEFVDSVDVLKRLNAGDVWEGTMCKTCVAAIIRMTRHGLCPDLFRSVTSDANLSNTTVVSPLNDEEGATEAAAVTPVDVAESSIRGTRGGI